MIYVYAEYFLERVYLMICSPFDDSFFTSKKNPLYGKNASRVMKTDIKENEGSYELDIDLPGFKKDEITAELKDGYLTVRKRMPLWNVVSSRLWWMSLQLRVY